MAYRVDDIRQADFTVHSVLDQRGYRVDRSREFFRVPCRELLRVFADHLAEPGSASFSAESASAPMSRPDPRSAEELFGRATELQHGQGDSLTDLGEAVRLFELAVARGHLEACRALIELNRENPAGAEAYRTRLRELRGAQMSERTRAYFTGKDYSRAWSWAVGEHSVPSLQLILDTMEEKAVNLRGDPVWPGRPSYSVTDLLINLETLDRTLPSAAAVDRWLLERTVTLPISLEDVLETFSDGLYAVPASDDLDGPDERCQALEWIRARAEGLRVLDEYYSWGVRFHVLDALRVEDLPYPGEDVRAFETWLMGELRPGTQ